MSWTLLTPLRLAHTAGDTDYIAMDSLDAAVMAEVAHVRARPASIGGEVGGIIAANACQSRCAHRGGHGGQQGDARVCHRGA